MLPISAISFLVLIVWGVVAAGWLGFLPYWARKFRTDARRREIQEEKSRSKRGLASDVWVALSIGMTWGVPTLFVVDGLIYRIGVLDSSSLSFGGGFALPLQIAGIVISAAGLAVMVAVGRMICEHIYARAKPERELLTTGLYRYIRHPFYLHFVLVPLGSVLITLNYLALIPLLGYLTSEGKPSFITVWMKAEEKELLERFGDDYRNYMSRAGRLLPKLTRRKG